MNRERLIADAKAAALERAPRATSRRRRDGDPGRRRGPYAALELGVHLAWRAGRLSDHDALVGRALARVLAGGDLPHATTVTEAVPARSRARGVSRAVRRAQDARAHRAHAEDRQDAEELSYMPPSTRMASTIDRGHGPPLVLMPGLQGRWEWMAPTVEALAARFRVLTFSLGGVTGADAPARGVRCVRRTDRRHARSRGRSPRRGLRRVVRRPGRACTSRPATGSRVRARARLDAGARMAMRIALSAGHVRYPRLSLPVFAARAIAGWCPKSGALESGAAPALSRRASRPGDPLPRLARANGARVHAWSATDLVDACRRVTAPTLVVTGEPELDRVVPVDRRCEYVDAIPERARHACSSARATWA